MPPKSDLKGMKYPDKLLCIQVGMSAELRGLREWSVVQHKATHITLICQKCKNTKVIPCKPGLGGVMVPKYCDGAVENEFGDNQACGPDTFMILPHRSKFSDIQTLKLQVGLPLIH